MTVGYSPMSSTHQCDAPDRSRPDQCDGPNRAKSDRAESLSTGASFGRLSCVLGYGKGVEMNEDSFAQVSVDRRKLPRARRGALPRIESTGPATEAEEKTTVRPAARRRGRKIS